MNLLGGRLEITQACFTGNSNTLVGFQGKDGEPIVVANNFIAVDENSQGCPDAGSRIGIEPTTSDGCFTVASTGNCQVNCGGPLADSDVCLSQVELTEEPSASPTDLPSLSPSLNPSDGSTLSFIPTSGSASQSPSSTPSFIPTPGTTISQAPTSNTIISQVPSSTDQPTGPTSGPSSGPVEVEISASPTSFFPTIGVLPTMPPVFRPDCGKGKGGGKGYCRKKKSKGSKKSNKRSKLNKKSKKDIKKSKSDSSKDSKKVKKSSKSGKRGKGKGSQARPNSNPHMGEAASSKSGKGGKGKGNASWAQPNSSPVTGEAASSTNWNALGGVQGVYRTYHLTGNGDRRGLALHGDDRDEEPIKQAKEEEEEEEHIEYEQSFGEEDGEEVAEKASKFSSEGEEDDADEVYDFVFAAKAWTMPQELKPILIDETFRI